jgi:phosphohistidine swiveling domain-containing protein
MSDETSAWTWRCPPENPPDAGLVGGKALGLWHLERLGCRVPRWLVLTTRAHRAALRAGRGHGSGAGMLQLPPGVREELQSALAAAGLAEALLAVRSSADVEDAEQYSCAGMFTSVLGVPAADPDALAAAVMRVWASAESEWARAYQAAHVASTPPAMAVVLQEMVPAAASGVAFGPPAEGADGRVLVAAVRGLAERLVSGEEEGDLFELAGVPPRVYRRRRGGPPAGACANPLAAAHRAGMQRGEGPALSDAEAEEVARVVHHVCADLGAPQDIEWAVTRPLGAAPLVWAIQTRPLTRPPAWSVLPVSLGVAWPETERRIWDNSNIVESYSGVTSPLTFSFASGVYEQVYVQLCRVLGVEEALLERHRGVFASMLGRIRGRVYYNLRNWYRALSLLPGYSLNRTFMERMMGVREPLDEPPLPGAAHSRPADAARVVRMLFRLARAQATLRCDVRRFHRRVDSILAEASRALHDLETASSPTALLALYRRLERDLLAGWRVPLVNDFLTMISFGVLARLAERWVPGGGPSLVNDLLCGEGGIISAEPARRVEALAERVAANPAWMRHAARMAGETTAAESCDTTADDSGGVEELNRAVEGYLQRFGDRCANELKLETLTLADDPSTLWRTLLVYARRHVDGAAAVRREEAQLRSEAEAQVARVPGVARRAVLWALVRAARARVRDRENLRFERTRVFGLVRRLFLAMGAVLQMAGRLDEPRDVFYLTSGEVLAALEGGGATDDLRSLVGQRRVEMERHAALPAPPDRFETLGPPGDVLVADAGKAPFTGHVLRGVPCCRGLVRGPARVVRDPAEAPDLRGAILVAERTDPGWTLLFPLAAGLAVERGSPLSHSAIVAREVGLPCVVGVRGLLGTIRDGELLELDGALGTVTRLESEGGES